jgi:hypothetical protein
VAHTVPRIPKPILQFVDGTQITDPRFFYKIYQGYGFSVSHRFESVASDASVDLYFENPSASGREVFIVAVEVVSFAQAWVDVYRGNTVVASGTSITPVNLNFEKAYGCVVSAEYGGTYTPGTQVHETVCPGGSLVRAVGSAVEIGESVVIPEGFNLLVRATNKSASATDLSIRVIWWEESL